MNFRFPRAAKCPRDKILLNELGTIYGYLRNYEEAVHYFDRAISWYPNWSKGYSGKAGLYLQREGNIEKARAVLEKALENGLTENDFIDFLMTLDVYDRNYQGALDRLSLKSEDSDQRQFITNSLQYASIYEYMGKKELARKYYDDARSIPESQIEERPYDIRLHGRLGFAYAGLGRKEDAMCKGEFVLEHGIEHGKDKMGLPIWIETLARIYVMVGEFDEAIDQLEFLLSIPDDTSIPRFRLDPAWDPLRNHPRFKKLVEAGK